jgi:hypothetical protein
MAVISRKGKEHEAIDKDLSACVGDKEEFNCDIKGIMIHNCLLSLPKAFPSQYLLFRIVTRTVTLVASQYP